MNADSPTQPVLTAAILESISDGVFTVDADWRISFFNRAAEEITGIRREEAMGRPCSEVFKSSMCESDCALRQTLHNDMPVVNKGGFIIDVDGERIPISLSTAVLRRPDGQIIGGAETFRDLSEIEALRGALNARDHVGDLVSHSPKMRELFALIPAIAASASTVLLRGDTGTGKELMARAIHQLSPRADEPFIAVNCGALPDNLLESELFGYKKGAFTGAAQDKPGRFQLAGKGTLFLDEIGEISPALQVRLLRVLQEHTYEPLGSVHSESCQARIIAATHRHLSQMVEAGTFRQDLFYRINVVDLTLPPLRERKEDIPLLVDQFVAQFNRVQHKHIQGVSAEALALLIAHNWPGNVRELENVIERAFVLCPNTEITVAFLPQSIVGDRPQSQPDVGIDTARALAEKNMIETVLEKNGFNRMATARALGIHKTTLYRKMKSLGIAFPTLNGRHHHV